MRIVCEVDELPAAGFVLQDRLKPDARVVFQRILWPLAGTFLQEGIDVLVIANALRAPRGSRGT
jgi:hypothetical protein